MDLRRIIGILAGNREVPIRKKKQTIGSGRRRDIVIARKRQCVAVQGCTRYRIDVGPTAERRVEELHSHRVRMRCGGEHAPRQSRRSVH